MVVAMGAASLVAVCSAGPAIGAGLPDNRAYELVSPVDKLGIDILAESSRTHASAGSTATSPSAVSFAALGGFADVAGMGLASEYLAQRDGVAGTSGWTTHAITPRQDPMTFPGVAQSLESYYDGVIAPDLSKGIFSSWSPLADAPNVRQTLTNFYVREDLRTAGAGFYRLLTDAPTLLPAPDPPLSRILRYAVADATDALDHIVFESDAALTADARGNYPKVYKADGGVVRLLSVNEGCPGANENFARLGWMPGQCGAAGLGARALRYTPRTLSDDGSRVVFTAPVTSFNAIGLSDERAGVASKLFQLDDSGTLTTADDAVAHVSASEKSTPDTSQVARYQIASVDGSRVFFMSEEQLTDASGGGLYLWERQSMDETQQVAVDAAGGSFRLTFHTQVSSGTGELTSGSNTVGVSAGSFAVGQSVTGTGIPAGTTIVAMGMFNRPSEARMTLSANATATGTETLGASTDATTAPLPNDATPPQVQSALEGLPGIGAGNVRVAGGPGGAGGGSPYLVTFTGALAGVNVAELSADGSGLSGGSSTALVTTPRDLRNLTLIAPLGSFSTSGALGASEDGRRLYFAGDGGLVPGMPAVGGRALYYWQDADGTPGGTLAFIGDVAVLDTNALINTTAPSALPRLTRVTPDGRFMAFSVSLGGGLATRYDQLSECPADDENANGNALGGCSEVYVYQADSSSPAAPDIVCASCRPSGLPATASAWMMVRRAASATSGTTYLSRAFSDDGRRVLFSTAEALVPEDTNRKFDAYVYDVPSGTRYLLSSGKDTADSYFLDASADGDDAYFVTRERLVGWDTDAAYDLYDARVGGGFPEPVALLPECTGDACQGRAPGALAPAALGSVISRGAGNVGEAVRPRSTGVRCKRGKVKRRVRGRVRCVRRARGQRAKRRAAAKGRAK